MLGTFLYFGESLHITHAGELGYCRSKLEPLQLRHLVFRTGTFHLLGLVSNKDSRVPWGLPPADQKPPGWGR